MDDTLILMNAWFRRMLEPANTLPTDSFRWRDRRSKSQQVANGIRIAGGLIVGFLVMVALLGGLSRLSEHQSDQSTGSIFVSSAALVVAALTMIWTANRWAPFVAGFFFGPAVLKLLGILIVGDDSYYSAHSITRTTVAEFLAYALVVVGLTSRFIGKRPAQTTLLDRLALTFFVFATFKQVVNPYHFPPWPLLSGITALFVAWCGYRVARAKRSHYTHDDVGPKSPIGL